MIQKYKKSRKKNEAEKNLEIYYNPKNLFFLVVGELRYTKAILHLQITSKF